MNKKNRGNILDNNKEDIKNKELEATSDEALSDNDEIEFDDDIDISALQAQLQEHMTLENVEYTPEEEKLEPIEVEEEPSEPLTEDITLEQSTAPIAENEAIAPVEPLEVEVKNEEIAEPEVIEPIEPANHLTKRQQRLVLKDGERKYVIYIEPDNIDFIESLTFKERKKIINKILHEQDEAAHKRRELREKAKFTNQVIIMVLTVIIALPIFFVLLNKSIQITILNYQQAQQNFVKLYKEQGKIKSYKSFEKNFH